MKLFLKSLAAFIFTLLIVKGIHHYFVYSCNAITAFRGDDFIQFLNALQSLFIKCLLFILAFLLFRWVAFINKKISIFLYTMVCSLIISIPTILSIIKYHQEGKRTLIEGICLKSKDDGMICKMDKLTLAEYRYIKAVSNWLPSASDSVQSVSIDYYRDGFLPDYSLSIDMTTYQEIDTSIYNGRWNIRVDKDTLKQQYLYNFYSSIQ